ncbi:DUF1499 domain-containing protein [uncultured Roseibium sp.]|uniref:DUF1499 domain-containing protein n=1 Tax=uncultured Roseibium sp. TaxID=1936171 RepID=UPI0026076A38|nr:DUF1499 domain-containing protein [uncultured Roseibium sp.]
MKRYAAYKTRSAPASRIIGAVAVALAVTAYLSKRFGFVDADVFALSLAGAGIAALLAVGLALIAFQRIWAHGGPGLPSALTGMFLATIALVAPGIILGMLVLQAGPDDLSTNRIDPPDMKIQALSEEQPFLGWFNTSLETHLWPAITQVTGSVPETSGGSRQYPDIVPRRYRIPPAQLHAAGAKAVDTLGWIVVDELPPDLLDAPTRLQAVGTSRLLGLKHDVSLRIRPDPLGALLDVRARSQTPLKDLTGNADNIRLVFAEIDKVLLETYGDLARLSVDEGELEDEPEIVPLQEPRDTIPLPGFKPYFEEEEALEVDDFGLTDLEG